MSKLLLILIAVVVVVFVVRRQLGQVKPEDARALLQKGGRVIDVRTAGEYRGGHLEGALNIPLDELGERVAREFPDRDTPLLLHCASGARSAVGQRLLQKLGYRSVVNLGSYGRAAQLAQP